MNPKEIGPESLAKAEPTDEALVALVQEGDRERLGELMRRYEGRLLRYGRRFLKDPDNIVDLVQDIFIKAYENLQSFDTSRTFSSWIYRIAHNVFVNALKKQKGAPFISFDLDILTSHPVTEDSREREELEQEIKGVVESGLDTLAPKYREVLILYYFESLSYQEVSDILHVPIGTVSVRLKRAKDLLKQSVVAAHPQYKEGYEKEHAKIPKKSREWPAGENGKHIHRAASPPEKTATPALRRISKRVKELL